MVGPYKETQNNNLVNDKRILNQEVCVALLKCAH